MSGTDIVADVAGAVSLAEGEAGVLDVVRTVARSGSGSVRSISRSTELPVPLVSAICNELRRYGVVAREPPVRLTARGLDLFGDVNGRTAFAARCRRCDGRGIAVARPLAGVVRELRMLARQAPHEPSSISVIAPSKRRCAECSRCTRRAPSAGGVSSCSATTT